LGNREQHVLNGVIRNDGVYFGNGRPPSTGSAAKARASLHPSDTTSATDFVGTPGNKLAGIHLKARQRAD
tara:strand:- start:665 stop:874 length:210 start_codon:yes stop_codon:yes gene_type:complete